MGGKGSGRYPKGSGKHPRKKSGRGGARPGAGRPRLPENERKPRKQPKRRVKLKKGEKCGWGGPRPGSGRPKGSVDTKPRKWALMWKWRRVGGEWKRRTRFPVPVRDYLFSEGDMDYYHVGGGKVSGVDHTEWGDLEFIIDERTFYSPEERQVYNEIMEHARERIREIRQEKKRRKK